MILVSVDFSVRYLYVGSLQLSCIYPCSIMPFFPREFSVCAKTRIGFIMILVSVEFSVRDLCWEPSAELCLFLFYNALLSQGSFLCGCECCHIYANTIWVL